MTPIEIISRAHALGFVSRYVDISSIKDHKMSPDYFIFLCDVFYWLAHKHITDDVGMVLGIEGIVDSLLAEKHP